MNGSELPEKIRGAATDQRGVSAFGKPTQRGTHLGATTLADPKLGSRERCGVPRVRIFAVIEIIQRPIR